MSTVSLEEAQARLPKLIEQLATDGPIIITRDQLPVAQLASLAGNAGSPVPGRCRGMLTVVAEDDEHLADFREYMP
jgi:antitoxin (DNA-binding transcriptional repressor) of toxin-antitoxin stability system